MTILLSRIVPLEQLLIVHAPLGEVEWPGTVNFIESTLPAGVPFILAPIASGKSLLETVEQRGRWPSPKARYCTAGHKRGPIERELRRHLRAHPRFERRLVNAMGLRRDESRERAKRDPWRRNERMSVAGREVYDWLPVFDLTTEDIFRVIDEAGQSPHGCQFRGYHKALMVRRGYKRAIVATAHKLLRVLYVVLRDARPYHDPEADYEELMVRRNAPRWIRMLHRYGLIEHEPATAAIA